MAVSRSGQGVRSCGKALSTTTSGAARAWRAGVEEGVAGAVEGAGVVDREVGVEGGGTASGRLDLRGGGRGARLVAAVVDADVVAGLGEGDRDGPAEAAARPRDEGGHDIRPTGSVRVSAVISVA